MVTLYKQIRQDYTYLYITRFVGMNLLCHLLIVNLIVMIMLPLQLLSAH